MQLKMESSNTGKSKQQQPPPQPPPQSTSIQGLSPGSAASSIASSVSPTTTTSGSLGSAQQQQQHQNGSSSSGPILPNGAKYRARPTMPVSSTSSLASPSVNLWQQQYRFVNTLPLRFAHFIIDIYFTNINMMMFLFIINVEYWFLKIWLVLSLDAVVEQLNKSLKKLMLGLMFIERKVLQQTRMLS